ncbi:Zinc finger, RING-type [Corchorus capsularis]|uniref:RING-type E3 ubiquitin transferase n=1 Tax=Corchorus capsularis TaxID=210143 RepID=A0A1R3FYX7_COCAP|nr:Zinc finger, RING-type [Corchorus capsularis]
MPPPLRNFSHGGSPPPPLKPKEKFLSLILKALKEIPQFRFPEGTEATRLESDLCVICLDGFKQGQWCRNLVGCGHFFHRKCVDAWLIKVAACPICRTSVPLDHEDEGIWGFGTSRTDFQGLLDFNADRGIPMGKLSKIECKPQLAEEAANLHEVYQGMEEKFENHQKVEHKDKHHLD